MKIRVTLNVEFSEFAPDDVGRTATKEFSRSYIIKTTKELKDLSIEYLREEVGIVLASRKKALLRDIQMWFSQNREQIRVLGR